MAVRGALAVTQGKPTQPLALCLWTRRQQEAKAVAQVLKLRILVLEFQPTTAMETWDQQVNSENKDQPG